jgi:hypothetical protein
VNSLRINDLQVVPAFELSLVLFIFVDQISVQLKEVGFLVPQSLLIQSTLLCQLLLQSFHLPIVLQLLLRGL